MALIDRVKERIETDLSDAELQLMIDEVTAEIERRYGAIAQMTVSREGGGGFIVLRLPIDEALAIAVVEFDPRNEAGADAQLTLAADDYRIRNGGLTLERLIDGTNGRERWAPLVEVTYTPQSDQAQRDEVTIQVVQLEIADMGLAAEKAGDWSATHRNTAAERERLIAGLDKRGGLVMA